jgi:hypothetical protein
MSWLVDLLYVMPAANAVTPTTTSSDPTRTDNHDDVDVVSRCGVNVLFPRRITSVGFLAPDLPVNATSLVILEAIFTSAS